LADAIGVDVEAIAVGQNLADHRVDAAAVAGDRR
jgi:hypothetical protein